MYRSLCTLSNVFQNKIEELRQAIASWESKQKSLEQSRKEDKDYVDEERKELASETRGVEKQFADDKRELINKMENAKYQVQKYVVNVVDSLTLQGISTRNWSPIADALRNRSRS